MDHGPLTFIQKAVDPFTSDKLTQLQHRSNQCFQKVAKLNKNPAATLRKFYNPSALNPKKLNKPVELSDTQLLSLSQKAIDELNVVESPPRRPELHSD